MLTTNTTRRVWPAYLLSVLALGVALGATGPGAAALAASKKHLITGQAIKDGSLSGKDIKDGSLTAADVAAGTFAAPAALANLTSALANLTVSSLTANSYDTHVKSTLPVPSGECISPQLKDGGPSAPGDIVLSTVTTASGGGALPDFVATQPSVVQASTTGVITPQLLICNWGPSVASIQTTDVVHLTVLHRAPR